MQPEPNVSLLRDERAEVFIEYLIVLSVVFIALAKTLGATGPNIVQNYQLQRSVLLSIDP
jgi:hypothetical protein